MIQRAILIAALLAAGCGGPERPQFTPAGADSSPSTSREPVRASREVAIPRNIESH
jgi:hypothetical protein